MASPSSNFAYLQQHDPQLARLDLIAERHFSSDTNTSLLKLRQSKCHFSGNVEGLEASRLLKSADLHDVQMFLGHAAITTTSRYLQSAPVRLERALARLEASMVAEPPAQASSQQA